MKISELNIGQGNVSVEGTVKEIGETRTFNKFGREISVANAILKDDSGSIKLTLWNNDIKRFKDGDKIKITNGYVNEFQGEKQLTSGKFGSMEKLNKEGKENEESEIAEEETLF
jgi:replication factor A1